MDRARYELEVDERFDAPELDRSLWLPFYLPHWSSRERAAARYDVGGGRLRLRIDVDQPPWNPEMDGDVRVSSLQTGQFAGPVGSPTGQHRFRDALRVRERQENVALYTPRHGLFEVRLRASDDPSTMVALWLIGYEDAPERSAEICACEIFGRDVSAASVSVGVGIHPFGDPSLSDEFERVTVSIDAREPHWYSAEWTPERVRFFVDDRLVKVAEQSPAYPMQVMLSLYEFRDRAPTPAEAYPKTAEIEAFRAYRRSTGS
jgi:hypothetical protein